LQALRPQKKINGKVHNWKFLVGPVRRTRLPPLPERRSFGGGAWQAGIRYSHTERFVVWVRINALKESRPRSKKIFNFQQGMMNVETKAFIIGNSVLDIQYSQSISNHHSILSMALLLKIIKIINML
jgi:hypothetical protein